MHVLGAVALAMAWVSGAASQQPSSSESMAPLWTVHIDEVRPDKAAEFERLNVAENRGVHAILREHGQSIKPVYEIMTTGNVYMSLRPKLSFTAFDAPSTVPDSVSSLFAAVTDSLDAPIHAALRYHHNEIWRYHRTDSGDGAYKYLWQADSREAFVKAGDRASVLTAVFGKSTADQMLADWQSCLAGSETVDATARRDFTDLSESEPWLGLPTRDPSRPGER
jgi:hypothetical protein